MKRQIQRAAVRLGASCIARTTLAVVAIAVTNTAHAIPIYYAANGHSYEVFEARAILWDEANALATSKGGYLATLTDHAEKPMGFR